MLVIAFHFFGWRVIHGAYPEMTGHPNWRHVIDWVETFGVIGLFVVAMSPLPQTPALVFFGITRHDYVLVFLAILAGKTIKYGVFAWGTARFPERLSGDRLLRATGSQRAPADPPPAPEVTRLEDRPPHGGPAPPPASPPSGRSR